MVGDVTGYGGWRNSGEVVNMGFLDDLGKKNHIKKLWEEDSKKYFEWKEWCIKLNRLPHFFGTRHQNEYVVAIIDYYNFCKIYLKKNNGSFEIVARDLATHVLEQVFDEDNQLISEELKEL